MPIAELRAVVLDTPEPRKLAEFYRALVGGEITSDDGEWVTLRDGGLVLLSFQLAPDYQPPVWPSAEHGQQFHIDVTVDDVDRAEAEVLALGATKHEVQPPEARGVAGLPRPDRAPLLPVLGLATSPTTTPMACRTCSSGGAAPHDCQHSSSSAGRRPVADDAADLVP